jgi:hypothetical protein
VKNKWSDQDKQAFRDGNVLKAKSVPPKRFGGPSSDEWERPVLERTHEAQRNFDGRLK